MTLVSEIKFCKTKEVEGRDHIAHLLFFERGLKLPYSAFRKELTWVLQKGSIQRERKKGFSEILKMWWEVPAEALVKCSCSLKNSIRLLHDKLFQLPLIRFSTLPFSSRRKRPRGCNHVLQARKGQASSSLAMTNFNTAQNWGQAEISWLTKWGKMCLVTACDSKIW